MRGLWSTLVLILVLVGLVSYIYFVDSAGDGSAETGKDKAFASVTAEDIEEIEIASADGEMSRLAKVDGTWRLVAPVQADADENEVMSITGGLASLEIQRVVDENATDVKQYGLDPGRIAVGFRTKGATEMRRILLGEKTPTGGDLYARLPDQKRVFLVSSFLDTTFNKNTFALREKGVLTIDRAKVDGVDIVAGARSIRLAKNGSEWRIVQPLAGRADFAAVEGALERLSSAQMQAIVAPEGGDLKRYKLDPPVATFTAIAGSSRAALQFGETENALIYAKDASRPMVFTVAPTLYTDLVRDLAEFRRKDLFDARSFTARRVEFQRGNETLVLTKTSVDGKDVWRHADGKDVDTMKAEDLLAKVTALRADTFDSAVSGALKTPELSVNVAFDDNKTEQVVFARSAGDVVARRSDEPGSARLMAGSFDEVLKALDAVK